MKLLTKAIKQTLPPLYSQEQEKDPKVRVKFFDPCSNWKWYGIEGSQEEDDFIFPQRARRPWNRAGLVL